MYSRHDTNHPFVAVATLVICTVLIHSDRALPSAIFPVVWLATRVSLIQKLTDPSVSTLTYQVVILLSSARTVVTVVCGVLTPPRQDAGRHIRPDVSRQSP